VEAVERDVAFGLVTRDKALRSYGVVLGDDGAVDADATDAERSRQRDERGPAKDFDFGPPLDEALAACEAETGLPAPSPARPLRWAPLEDAESAMARARAAAGDGGMAVPAD
jgi:N-methylhydantoinase B